MIPYLMGLKMQNGGEFITPQWFTYSVTFQSEILP